MHLEQDGKCPLLVHGINHLKLKRKCQNSIVRRYTPHHKKTFTKSINNYDYDKLFMTKKADLGSKRLISLAPNNWVRWITQAQTLEVQEFLSSEFQWIGRDNDVLLKVTSPEKGTFLILNELQLKYKKEMPLRMRAYTALAEEKYHLPVYPVLINILPHSINKTIPNTYESEFEGIKSYQNYRVINL